MLGVRSHRHLRAVGRLGLVPAGGLEHVERELLVARVEGSPPAVDACLAQFGGRLLQRAGNQSVAEFTGRAEEVDAFLDAVRLAGDIVDHARSGIAAIERPLALA